MVHSKHDTLCTSDGCGPLFTPVHSKADVSTIDGNWGGEHMLPRTEIQVHTVVRWGDRVPGSHLLETILCTKQYTWVTQYMLTILITSSASGMR